MFFSKKSVDKEKEVIYPETLNFPKRGAKNIHIYVTSFKKRCRSNIYILFLKVLLGGVLFFLFVFFLGLLSSLLVFILPFFFIMKKNQR